MADTKISNLPAATNLSGTDSIPLVNGNQTKKTTLNDIKTFGNTITGDGTINKIIKLSLISYNSIPVKDANTLYVIV